MARETLKKVIDDRNYEFSQMNTSHSLKMLAKLTRILGEPMMLAISAFLKLKGDGKKKVSLLDLDLKNLDTDILSKAVRSLIERMDEDEVVLIVKKLTSEGVLCDHKQIVFDDHFEGNLGHLFKVLVAALEAQYGNFTGAILVPSSPAKGRGIKSV